MKVEILYHNHMLIVEKIKYIHLEKEIAYAFILKIIMTVTIFFLKKTHGVISPFSVATATLISTVGLKNKVPSVFQKELTTATAFKARAAAAITASLIENFTPVAVSSFRSAKMAVISTLILVNIIGYFKNRYFNF